jgi:hypothetical protein
MRMRSTFSVRGAGALTRPGRLAAVVVLMLSVCAHMVGARQSVPPHGVLALYWHGPETSPNIQFRAGLQKVLRGAGPEAVEYFSEYLETDLFPGREQARILRDYLVQKYAGRKIDVLVTEAEPARAFLLENQDLLFPGVPIVYASFAPPPAATDTGPGMTGVIATGACRQTLELARRLQPSITGAFVVLSMPEKEGVRLEAAIRRELEPLESWMPVTYLTDRPTGEAARRDRSSTRALGRALRPTLSGRPRKGVAPDGHAGVGCAGITSAGVWHCGGVRR